MPLSSVADRVTQTDMDAQSKLLARLRNTGHILRNGRAWNGFLLDLNPGIHTEDFDHRPR